MDGGEEVASGLVVAGGDCTELLELGKEVFDQMPCRIEVAVIVRACQESSEPSDLWRGRIV